MQHDTHKHAAGSHFARAVDLAGKLPETHPLRQYVPALVGVLRVDVMESVPEGLRALNDVSKSAVMETQTQLARNLIQASKKLVSYFALSNNVK